MPSSGAHVTESLGDLRAVVLENEVLRVTFLVDYGCDIAELFYKPRGTEFLWRAPYGRRRRNHFIPTSPSERPFNDYYSGGWQELFPHAGAGAINAGAQLGFHGEVWGLPWEYEILDRGPAEAAVRFHVRTVRTPFLLERTVSLRRGEPTLRFRERVTNEGKRDLDFMWGHHPAFGGPFLDAQSVLDSDARHVRVDGEVVAWPVDARGVDHSLLTPQPGTICEVMKYLQDFREGWVALTQPKWNLGIGLVFDPAVFRYVWLWHEFEYTRDYPWFGRAYVLGVEPQSSLPRAHETGDRLLRLAAGKSLETEMLAVAYTASRVKHISRTGRVE